MTIPEFRLECLRIVSQGPYKHPNYLKEQAQQLFEWIFQGHTPEETEHVIISKLNFITQKLIQMADKFDVLTEEVGSISSVVDSAVTLLDGIADQLAEAKDDPAQIQVIVDNLRAKKESLAAAVQKNTPGETPS